MRKLLVSSLGLTLFFLFRPIAKADTVIGCGAGSGSTIDATCTGSVSDSSGVWSGIIQVSITAPFILSPTDPPFVFQELGSAAVNVDQFDFSFNTNSGTFSLTDITNNAYVLDGALTGFTTGTDSITLSGFPTQQTFYLAGSSCSVTDLAACVLAAGGTAATSALTDEPTGTGTINYVGDPVVTSMTFSIPAPTPEPSSLLLLGTGVAGLGLVVVRRKHGMTGSCQTS